MERKAKRRRYGRAPPKKRPAARPPPKKHSVEPPAPTVVAPVQDVMQQLTAQLDALRARVATEKDEDLFAYCESASQSWFWVERVTMALTAVRLVYAAFRREENRETAANVLATICVQRAVCLGILEDMVTTGYESDWFAQCVTAMKGVYDLIVKLEQQVTAVCKQ